MSKGTRFLTVAVPVALVYLLMLASILPVPFVDADTASLILPVVSVLLVSHYLEGREAVLCVELAVDRRLYFLDAVASSRRPGQRDGCVVHPPRRRASTSSTPARLR